MARLPRPRRNLPKRKRRDRHSRAGRRLTLGTMSAAEPGRDPGRRRGGSGSWAVALFDEGLVVLPVIGGARSASPTLMPQYALRQGLRSDGGDRGLGVQRGDAAPARTAGRAGLAGHGAVWPHRLHGRGTEDFAFIRSAACAPGKMVGAKLFGNFPSGVVGVDRRGGTPHPRGHAELRDVVRVSRRTEARCDGHAPAHGGPQ